MSYRLILLTFLMLFAGSSGVAAELVTVSNVRVWSGPESTRIVFDLSAPVEYKTFMLTEPHRLVVDLDGARLAENSLNEAVFKDVGMHGVRHAPRSPADYRIVFDLQKAYKPSTFQISPSHMYGQRLVIDLLHLDSETSASEDARAPVTDALSALSPALTQTAPTQTAPTPGSPATPAADMPDLSPPNVPVDISPRPFVVVIDPGHGGEDPGAIGPRGTYEKNVVLAFSRKLQQRLNAREGVVAHLTRTGDYFIPLATRTRIARQKQADLFISIHTDGARNFRARGASVYALSHRGATSETAKWLAQRENASDLVGGVSLDDKEDTLAYVLLDLSQSATLDASLFLGRTILGQLANITSLHSKKVEQAGFLVLRSPDIPSVLVELGYITNPEEERLLTSHAYQEKLLAALDAGVGEFYAQRGSHRYVALAGATTVAPATPPAAGRSTAGRIGARQKHTVSRGDTLEQIARRYNVSASALRRVNGLSGDVIYAGSTLLIP